jgi:hypothetical protein
MLLPHISFYIFKPIIFPIIEVLDFEIFKNLKMKGSLCPYANNTFRLSSNLVLEKYIHVAFAYFSCRGQGEQVWRRPIDGRPAGCVRGKVRSDERASCWDDARACKLAWRAGRSTAGGPAGTR